MKKDKNNLENMLKSGMKDLSDERLQEIIEAELSKPENEIDTDLIDAAFSVMNTPSSKRIVFSKPVKTLLAVAVISVLALSALSVVARNSDRRNPVGVIPVTEADTTEEQTQAQEEQTTSAKKSSSGKSANNDSDSSNSEEDEPEVNDGMVTVPDFAHSYTENKIKNSKWAELLDISFIYRECDEESMAGAVERQSIEPGTQVEVGTHIDITVLCYTRENYYIGNYIGKTWGEFKNAPDTGGNVEVIVRNDPSAYPTDDMIIVRQDGAGMLKTDYDRTLIVEVVTPEEYAKMQQ